MAIEIRPFRDDGSDDIDALTDLIHRAYAAHLAHGLRYWGTHQSAADTLERLRSGRALLLFVAGCIAGTATVRPPQPASPVALYRDPQVRSLSQFCVDPAHHGRGLGRRLHEEAIALARRSGASTMALDTAAPATGLIRLYESWGYRVVGSADWRLDTNYESVVMARSLALPAP